MTRAILLLAALALCLAPVAVADHGGSHGPPEEPCEPACFGDLAPCAEDGRDAAWRLECLLAP